MDGTVRQRLTECLGSGSKADRALASSSVGSTPRSRTVALAEPFSMRMMCAVVAVNPRWKPATVRAVARGRAIARFLGTSSPTTIVTAVAISRPRASEIPDTAESGTPSAASGATRREAMAGSARKPMARFVTVIPSCAPESWVDREIGRAHV